MDKTSFTAAVERYQDMVYRVALHVLASPQDADDAVQEVFLKLYTAQKPFQGEEHLRRWLLRVTVNHCRDVLRSPWRKRRASLAELPPPPVFQQAEPEAPANVQAILEWINGDLSERYPAASDAASMEPDRGALRALVWSEKVTRMLQSLLARYVTQGDRMLENTGVFVCTICGFVYIGDTPPELCPVCKVPGWRFEKAERRVS